MERKKLTRRVGMVAALVAVMVLAACDTQPATNVTPTSATLNAKGACAAGTSGNWWYQLRNASAGGGFGDVGPAHSYSCGANSGEVNLDSYNVTGLVPDTVYQFRIRSTVNGGNYTFDANGASGGTSYDSFRTPGGVSSEQLNGPDPAAQVEPCTPAPGYDTCASSNLIKKKIGLENRMLWVWANGSPFEFDVADQRAWFSWGYNLTTRNIRWIDKSGQGRCLAPIGTCTIRYGTWRTEVCDRSGADTCLFRRESDADVSFTYGVAFHRHLISCVGTRINWDGTHMRNTWEGDCAARAASARVADVRNQKLVIGEGKNRVRVDRYLSDAAISTLDRVCVSENASERKCRKVALRLFHSLPSEVRQKVKP
jgi:hypothetical protein